MEKGMFCIQESYESENFVERLHYRSGVPRLSKRSKKANEGVSKGLNKQYYTAVDFAKSLTLSTNYFRLDILFPASLCRQAEGWLLTEKKFPSWCQAGV
ncbi:hypothetical protein KM043_004141 [Ampulex compressa]|nr:hypothetical protein KM043_004141 [Ampulex compressa]